MARPLKLHRVDITDDHDGSAVEDPALAALHAEGWAVVYCWIATIESPTAAARTYLNLVLAPPPDPSALLPRVEDVERKLMATRKQATAAVLASLMIVAMSAAVTVWAVFW